MTVTLRQAGREDVGDLLRLIRDLARYEQAEEQVTTDEEIGRASCRERV